MGTRVLNLISWNKMLQPYQGRFQERISEWKVSEYNSSMPYRWQVGHDLGNGPVQNRRQVVVWTNGYPITRLINAPQGKT